MKIDNSYHIKAAKKNLKKELDNLNNAHENELKEVKIKHNNRKTQIDNAYQADLIRIESESQQKLLTRNLQNEQTLEKLQDSLEDVKERVQKEKDQIQQTSAKKLDEESQLFEAKIQNRRVIQNAQLDDLHHEAQIEQQKLARSKSHEKQQIEFDTTIAKKETLSGHEVKVQTSKDIFNKEYHAQVDKYRDALKSQQSDFEKESVQEERKHFSSLSKDKERYQKEAELIQSDGDKKINDLRIRYEEKFEQNFKLTQKNLQELNAKREKLENDLMADMKEDVKFEVSKESDPFYKFQKLAPEIGFDSEKNAYTIEIDTTADDAKNFKMTAHDRELKLQMKRDYEFSNTNDAGISSATKKFENYSTKIPVDEIVNPKAVTKSFKDGVLRFEVKLA